MSGTTFAAGGMDGRKTWVVFGLAAALLLSFGGGCSGNSSSNPACASWCAGACRSLETCGETADASCEDRCTSGFGTTSCAKARPADQLTCAELKPVFACVDYCGTLCERAPSCGSFNAQQCSTGCIMAGPDICNSASVAARTCDQLKPELRAYQDLAQAASMTSTDNGTEPAKSGDSSAGSVNGPSSRFGLCHSASDCTDNQGCSLATNTCGACTTNADCVDPAANGPFLCDEKHTCQEVDCLKDDDCFGGVCDLALHTCST